MRSDFRREPQRRKERRGCRVGLFSACSAALCASAVAFHLKPEARRWRCRLVGAAWPWLALLSEAQLFAQAPPPERVALTNARIVPVVGEPIEKGTLLIERGKIAAVGVDLQVPFDARVFDLSGKVLFPGTVDVHRAEGIDIPNEPRPVTPQLDVYDALDPSSLFFEESLRLGTSAVHVIPGNNTVIGGLGRVVRPIGMSVAEMTVAEGSFLKLSVSPQRDFDRMRQMATLRETFAELWDYLDRLAESRYEQKLKDEDRELDIVPLEARKRGRELIRAEDLDDKHRNVLRLLGGQVRVLGEAGPNILEPLGAFVYCQKAMDVAHAVQLAREHGFLERLVLVLGTECYKAIEELKAAARPVVLSAEFLHRETDPLTGEISEVFVPKKIADAGLLFAVEAGPDESLPEHMLTYQAARLVRGGVSRAEALRAITINPARILGLEQRLGSLEPGKDANVVVYSGDPLDFTSLVEKVFIDGILAYEREKDVRLQRLLVRQPTAEKQPEKPKEQTRPAETETRPAEPESQPAGEGGGGS